MTGTMILWAVSSVALSCAIIFPLIIWYVYTVINERNTDV